MGIPHLEEKGRLGSGLARTVIKMHPDSGAVCQPSVGPERSECSEAKVTTTPLVPSRCSGVAVALAESQFIESRDALAVCAWCVPESWRVLPELQGELPQGRGTSAEDETTRSPAVPAHAFL